MAEVNIIPLTEDYRLSIDQHSHNLERNTRHVSSKDNLPFFSWDVIGHYGSITAAVKGAMKHDAKHSSSLSEVLERIDIFESKIDKQLKGV